jgi:Trk K+ transport system NAD-binding subunit
VSVIVCGLGQVGLRVATLLLKIGESVTVITLGARPGFEKQVTDLGGTVLHFDARDSEKLREAGVTEARALIACTSADLSNIEICIDARAANPNLRIVARIFDQNLANRLEETIGIDRTLAMSNLAAPKFAAEALQNKSLGTFFLHGKKLSVNLGEEVNSSEMVTFQDPEVGTISVVQSHSEPHSSSKGKIERDLVMELLRNIPRELMTLLKLVGGIALVSTVIFYLFMKISLVDSLYFVITTLTTTGYGDFSVKEEHWALKIYAILMMLCGSASVAILYSILTNYIVSSRFEDVFGRQLVQTKNHVIVVGIGNVGFRIVESLTAMGVPVVAVDRERTNPFRQQLQEEVPFIVGDGREPSTLQRASVTNARAIIATTEDDAINLSIGLTSKKLKPDIRTVVRLFEASFAQKVEATLEIDRALSASLLSAPGFVGAALYDMPVFSFVLQDCLFVIVRTPNDSLELRQRKMVK